MLGQSSVAPLACAPSQSVLTRVVVLRTVSRRKASSKPLVSLPTPTRFVATLREDAAAVGGDRRGVVAAEGAVGLRAVGGHAHPDRRAGQEVLDGTSQTPLV